MSTQSMATPCLGFFDPAASECASCAVAHKCIHEQQSQLQTMDLPPCREELPEKVEMVSNRQQPQSKAEAPAPSLAGTQIIRKHSRSRLEIPPVGVRLRTFHKGKTYEAVVVADASNLKGDGRSVLFEGKVYQTLTAAAHAIAPGINSGSVWQIV